MTPTTFDTDSEALPPRGGRRDPFRLKGKGRWIGVGVAIAFLIGVVGIYTFSQTRWGRERVLTFTLGAIGGSLNGIPSVERIDGNLLTGAKLYGFSLTDSLGVPLAVIDSVYVRYRVASFTGGDMVINQLDAYGADISVFRLPGDTLWNYEKIFLDPEPSVAGQPRATLIQNLRLFDADISVRAPLATDSRLPAARQESLMMEMLADTARWMIEGNPGSYIRTSLIDVAHAELTEVYISPDERGGIFLQVVDGAANVRLWMEPPLEIIALSARLHLQQGIVNYEADRIALPNSTGISVGRIDLTGERPMYDVKITTTKFAFSDLRWLYPWLPEDPAEGGGSLTLWVEDQPDGLLVVARDVILDMPGTHITGKFGMLTEPARDAINFVDVALEADSLRVEAVEHLLPEDLPVNGLVIGGATILGS